jgi:hypothetical protein
MKPAISLCCVVLALAAGAWAQTAPAVGDLPALPKNLAAYKGQRPARFIRLPAVKKRLQLLLKKNYGDFTRRLEAQGPFAEIGDFLVATGHITHEADAEEAILVIGLKDQSLACAMFSNGAIGFKPNSLGGIHVATEKSVPALMNEWLAAKQKLLTKQK